MTFEDFLARVDNYLANRIGLCHDDLEDHLWHDAWSDGATPEVEAADFLMEIME